MFRLDDLQYRLLPYVTLRSNDEELRRITVRRITEIPGNYGDGAFNSGLNRVRDN
jgi:hypothetical protein